VTGCTKVSARCDHCYAETFAERWRGIPGHHFESGFDVTLRPERVDQPLRRRVARSTARRAIAVLRDEGVIFTVQGRGSCAGKEPGAGG
jgi:protein gp37